MITKKTTIKLAIAGVISATALSGCVTIQPTNIRASTEYYQLLVTDCANKNAMDSYFVRQIESHPPKFSDNKKEQALAVRHQTTVLKNKLWQMRSQCQ